ncbi:hypothetical protein ArsFIN_12570 [Arsenophonus nasoniae]|uniref:Uncharacterized protein n=1 Tax=Arsenophonus nasoniae TaxID=638 RepID=A0A4P7KYY2_9GAMM|nr:hypothetical protein ArsFIN_12570 [Arsenophonus nasoniae]
MPLRSSTEFVDHYTPKETLSPVTPKVEVQRSETVIYNQTTFVTRMSINNTGDGNTLSLRQSVFSNSTERLSQVISGFKNQDSTANTYFTELKFTQNPPMFVPDC